MIAGPLTIGMRVTVPGHGAGVLVELTNGRSVETSGRVRYEVPAFATIRLHPSGLEVFALVHELEAREL